MTRVPPSVPPDHVAGVGLSVSFKGHTDHRTTLPEGDGPGDRPKSRTTYHVTFKGETGWNPDDVVLRLRLMLKHSLRSYGLRCTRIEPKPAGDGAPFHAEQVHAPAGGIKPIHPAGVGASGNVAVLGRVPGRGVKED